MNFRNCILIILAVALHIGFAQVPARPNPPKLVNIFFKEGHEFLNEDQKYALNKKLENFAKETSNQIVVVAIDELNGLEPVEFATKIGQEWGVGQKDKRNGLVVLVKLPSSNDPRRNLFIAVGYGLEGALPDLRVKRIREELILPLFKSGNYYNGLDKGTDALMLAAKGEYNEKVKMESGDGVGVFMFIIIIIIIFIIFRSISRGGGRNRGGGFTYYDGGLFNNWSGGGDSSSDGGGGWDFGGGDFGGGGSGGDW